MFRAFVTALSAGVVALSLAFTPTQAEARDRSGAIVAGAILGAATAVVVGSAIANAHRGPQLSDTGYEPVGHYGYHGYHRPRPHFYGHGYGHGVIVARPVRPHYYGPGWGYRERPRWHHDRPWGHGRPHWRHDRPVWYR